MTNDVYTIGLTRTELQTLKVLLPITFPVIPYDTEQLDESEIKRITGQARCIVLNPKHLDAEILAEFFTIRTTCAITVNRFRCYCCLNN